VPFRESLPSQLVQRGLNRFNNTNISASCQQKKPFFSNVTRIYPCLNRGVAWVIAARLNVDCHNDTERCGEATDFPGRLGVVRQGAEGGF
jgi:hypothetical protein